MVEVFDKLQAGSPPVIVNMDARWSSGSTSMHVTISFGTHTLEDALDLIRRTSPTGAPLFNATLEEGTS